MKFNSYRLYARAFGIFSLLCILSFTLFYFNNYLLFDVGLVKYSANYETLEYVRFAIVRIIDFLLPTLMALILLPRMLYARAYRLYPTALLLASAHLFYNILYYYLYHIAYRYDSIESILISVPLSVIITAVYALYVLFLAFVAKLVFLKRGGNNASPTEHCFALKPTSATGTAVFSIVFINFIVSIIGEAFDTVTFFAEYADSYTMGELLYILGSYVYLLLVMLLAALLCSAVYNKIIVGRFEKEEKNGAQATSAKSATQSAEE